MFFFNNITYIFNLLLALKCFNWLIYYYKTIKAPSSELIVFLLLSHLIYWNIMYSDINPTTPIFPGPVTYRHSRISNIVAILMGKYLICTERKCCHFENTKTIILSNTIKNTKWRQSKISNRYYNFIKLLNK